MALTLARERDINGRLITGNKGLAMFFVRLRDPSTQQLNGITVMRLKDKMGTKQLPTAELTLNGCRARKVSADGRGIPTIATMINVTRVYNAIAAVGHQRRMLLLARDYAHRRSAFGKPLAQQPLHANTLAKMEVESRGNVQFVFEMARLLGLSETGKASAAEDMLLRLLTPVCKLYTGKQAVAIASEGLESFGGHGYVEDSGLPETLRDAQVLSIWEGTTNVLGLDVLRVFAKAGSNGAVMDVFSSAVKANVQAGGKLTSQSVAAIERALGQLSAFCEGMAANMIATTGASGDGPASAEIYARDLGFTIARVYAASLLCAQAAFTQREEDAEVLRRWVEEGLIVGSLLRFDPKTSAIKLEEAQRVKWDAIIGASPVTLQNARPFGPSFAARL